MNTWHDSSFLPFGNQDESTELSPAMEQCALNIYRQAWNGYRAAGCPYGDSDEAMLVWYSFQNEREKPFVITTRN